MIRAIVIAAVLAGPVAAQDHESHTSIPPSPMPESLDRLLKMRNFELLFNDIANNKRPGNDGMAQARNALLSQYHNASPELKKWAEEWAKKNHVDLSQLAQAAEQANHQFNRAPAPWSATNVNQHSDMAAARVGEQFTDVLRKLNLHSVAGRLEQSPAYQDALRQMARGDQMPPGPFTLDNVESAMRHLEGFIDQIQQRLPESMRHLPHFDLRVPSVGRGISLLPDSLSGPWSWSGVGQTAIVVTGVAVCVWILIHLTIPTRNRRRGSGQHYTLINPDSVVSRKDLIEAFERLALVFFGNEATHWHHHRIALRLGEKTQAPTEADLLAAMYEQARYAPDATGIDWRNSQAALRRLSGSGR